MEMFGFTSDHEFLRTFNSKFSLKYFVCLYIDSLLVRVTNVYKQKLKLYNCYKYTNILTNSSNIFYTQYSLGK